MKFGDLLLYLLKEIKAARKACPSAKKTVPDFMVSFLSRESVVSVDTINTYKLLTMCQVF